MKMDQLKSCIEKEVERKHDEIWKLSNFLFQNPEEGMREYKATERQCTFLRKTGFATEEGVGGMDTAFIGTYTHGNGTPCIGIFSEYDCLPDGLGHACGHNLIAAATMGAAAAVRAAMEEFDIDGTLMVIGAPDEEFTGGKIPLLKNGYLDKLDATMAVHPTSAVSRVAGGNYAYLTYRCEYIGKAAHSGSRPWEGINAQDAVVLFFNALGCARQMLQDGIRVQAYVKDGMQHEGTISAYTELGCDISAPNVFMLEKAAERIERCFQCGAVGTGCELRLQRQESSKNRIPNQVLGEVFRNSCIALGENMMEGMPDDTGGEDLGDVSHVIPSINPHLTILPERKISLHTPEFRDQVMTPAGEAMCILGAKALACTALELMCRPELLKRAKDELEQRLIALYGKNYSLYQ